jgi:ABC-type glycerol-3-phosphate transport system substrate-binding protein
MNPKLLKIAAVIAGVILIWLAVLWISNSTKTPEAAYSLEFWNVFDKTDDIKPLLTEFKNQTGIKVNYRSFTDMAEYRKTLLMELAAGQGPDILAINNAWIPNYRDLLTPLPEKDLNFTVKKLKENFVDAVAQGVILKEKIPASDAKLGRKAGEVIYGLPMYVDTLALFYNKELMRNVLSKPYAAPELTWAGVRNDVEQLAATDEKDVEGFRLAGVALGRTDNIARGLDIFYALYSEFGGKDFALVSREKGTDFSGKAAQPLTAALDFFTGFSRNSQYKYYSWNAKIGVDSEEKEINAFARGKVAMVAGYSYQYEEIKSLIQQLTKSGKKPIAVDSLGVSAFPQVLDPKSGNPKTALANYFALSVAKNSKYPQAAWQLILHLTSKDSLTQYNKATHKPTSRRDLIEAQRDDATYGIFAEQAVYATALSIADDEKAATVIGDAINSVADGEMTVSVAAQKIAKELAVK